MKGTPSRKVMRLLACFARCPRQFLPYVRCLPAWGRQPADVELPWFSFGAIEFLQRHVRREHAVFEFGSGGSSFFFARRAASVLSVENDSSWQQRVAQLATQRNLTNLRCELHPIDPGKPEQYLDLSYFTALQPLPYDIIVVDGWCDYENAAQGLLRQFAFDRALKCVRRPGGIIVVDDYWMFPEMAPRAPEARLTVFESPGPCRYGVTSTAVFAF
jgi:hypothetical protein